MLSVLAPDIYTDILSWLRFCVCMFKVEAVKLIAEGKAPKIKQPEEGATYECIQKKDNAKVGNHSYVWCQI